MTVHHFRNSCLLLLALLTAQGSKAATDVTALLLNNWGFDSRFDYNSTATGNTAQEILDPTGWTKEHSVDYTIVGTYEYGTARTFNTDGRIPAQGRDGSAGCLALSTGWSKSLIYTQTIKLPVGTWHLQSAWWNGSSQSAGTSLVGWIPVGAVASKSTLTSFAINQWTIDEQTFTTTRETSGRVRIGLKAADGASTSTARVVLDYVKLLVEEDAVALQLVRQRLIETITQATATLGDRSGNGASELQNAITQAQTLYDDGTVAYDALFTAYEQLLKATDDYLRNNISEEHPLDVTDDYIANPSFEQGTDGWTVVGLNSQTNSHFTHKKGTTYMETWTDRGGQVSDGSVSQTLRALPAGKYRLHASALHVQQKASGSDLNSGSTVQTGAWLYAGNFKTAITASADYTLDIVLMDDNNTLEIGAYVQNGTGNWFCIDGFSLEYTGANDAAAQSVVLKNLIEQANTCLASPLQNSAREQLSAAIQQAKAALNANEGISEAIELLTQALTTALQSSQLYSSLADSINYAKRVIGWWDGTSSKQNAIDRLKTATGNAETAYADYSLTDEQLQAAKSTLNIAVRQVDKRIYESDNAVGRGAALNNWDNNWCYERSAQSKHWIIFWDKGYGHTRPAGIDNILNTCDQVFEFYADSLKFITINQNKSKSDGYKMIIRLRSTTEWEANGSGIDDTIGMLTLSQWAYSSRGGQTMAHEIGHCFQYQVHCDNGDNNGWMYDWDDSQGNVFWEMCAQWQAYKFYPTMQFNGNEWLTNSLNGLYKHPLCEELRYENFFIQDFWAHKHGIGIIGRLWNESRRLEDPLQAYMRLTMTGTNSTERLKVLCDEMWEYGARMTTFDMDGIREEGRNSIGLRAQTAMTKQPNGAWLVKESNVVENFGHNAIRLNAPVNETTLTAVFHGCADTTGYRNIRTSFAGWRIGFVALQNDGTRVYGDVTAASKGKADQTVSFNCPDDCSYVWFIVSGAPSFYWQRAWDGDITDDEQWPYTVTFYNTNLYGQPNNYSGIVDVTATDSTTTLDNNVRALNGQVVRHGTTSLNGLPAGIYIVNGKKVLVK